MAEQVQRLMAATDAESLIEQIICARQLRSNIFGDGLFVDPPWDIVLTLFLAQLRNETVSVFGLAERASISMNAVDRWLGVLEQQGVIDRPQAAADAVELEVALSRKGSLAMRGWMAQWLNSPCASVVNSEVTSLLGRILGTAAK